MPSLANAILNRAVTSTVNLRFSLDSLIFRDDPRTLELLEALREKIAGKPILVAGNGPSLAETPLDRFRHLPAIGMNKIDLLFPTVAWRPTLIVAVNNLVVRQHRAEFANSNVPVFLASKCRWFLNRHERDAVHFFRNRPSREFSTNVLEGLGSISPTVTYSALQFAYSLGADPVILVGVDHRFDTDPAQSGIERREQPDVNHFSPDYFQPGQYWGLPDLAGSEQSYLRARAAFEAAGRRIYDATIGGALTVFPKISVDEALALTGSSDA